MPHTTTSDTTKKILTESLKELMATKSLEKITVREIVAGCGLNRQTFYYHFSDIYDQVRWMFEQEAMALLSRHEGVRFWQDGLLQFFCYLHDNRAMCLCALHSMGREDLKRFFYADIHGLIEKAVLSIGGQMTISPEYERFLTHYFTISLAAVTESWLLGEITLTPEDLIHFIDMAIQDQIRGALLRWGKNPPAGW